LNVHQLGIHLSIAYNFQGNNESDSHLSDKHSCSPANGGDKSRRDGLQAGDVRGTCIRRVCTSHPWPPIFFSRRKIAASTRRPTSAIFGKFLDAQPRASFVCEVHCANKSFPSRDTEFLLVNPSQFLGSQASPR
jgi:hypothetical protein